MRGYKSFDGTPHPGDLQHRVDIDYTKSEINENGYPNSRDVVLCNVWASATDAAFLSTVYTPVFTPGT